MNAQATAVTKTKAKTAPKAKAAPVEEGAGVAIKLTLKADASAAEVNKLIVSIKGRGAKLDTDIHSAAMACLFHADKHGDITLMNRLLLAMPKSGRRNALASWALAFGKFLLNDDAKARAESPLVFNREGSTDMKGAAEKPFWDFRNVREGGTEWVFTDYIGSVMRTLEAHSKQDTPEGRKAKAALHALAGVSEMAKLEEADTSLAH